MIDFLYSLARPLVLNPDAVKVFKEDTVRNDGSNTYHIDVDESDIGRVVGKNGKIARAIRTVARARAAQLGEKIFIIIE